MSDRRIEDPADDGPPGEGGFSPELLKGSFITLLLALLARHGAMYGYEIARRLSEESEGRISPGQSTLYPSLHTLEGRGWVDAYWSDCEGRKRKYYAVTTDGRRELERRRKEWRAFQRTLNLLLHPS